MILKSRINQESINSYFQGRPNLLKIIINFKHLLMGFKETDSEQENPWKVT